MNSLFGMNQLIHYETTVIQRTDYSEWKRRLIKLVLLSARDAEEM